MKNDGWGLFRPEVYDLKLMEYDFADGIAKEIGGGKNWDECPDIKSSRRNLSTMPEFHS